MKTVVVIQARMGSSRLPGKIMKPLNGIPLIKHLVDSFSTMDEVDDLVVATSVNKENDEFVKYLDAQKINYYRGDENDVLSRFVKIIDLYKPDIVVRVTADDPLMSKECLQEMLESHSKLNADYTFMKGLPIGISPEIVRAECLSDIYYNHELEKHHKEHVTIYLKEHAEQYKLNFPEAPQKLFYPDLSLTVDTVDEYNKMYELYELFKENITLEKVIHYLLSEEK